MVYRLACASISIIFYEAKTEIFRKKILAILVKFSKFMRLYVTWCQAVFAIIYRL